MGRVRDVWAKAIAWLRPRWFELAVSEAIGLLTGLIVTATLRLAVAPPLRDWAIVIAWLVVLGGVTAYLIVRELRRRGQPEVHITGNVGRLITVPGPGPPSTRKADLSKNYFEGEAIRLVDVATGCEIKGKTFVDCDLFGPAVVATFGEGILELQMSEPYEVVTLRTRMDQKALTGVIRLVDCNIRGCRSHAIAYVVPPDMLESWKAKWSSD